MATNTTLQTLQLGNVSFYNFEVPDHLPNLFGVQKLAVHDFPTQGQGNRTVQQLGSFPFPSIEWTACFWDNDTPTADSAIERASLVNTYRVQGTPQTLLWGAFNYQVIVAEFEIIGRLKQQLEYRIKLVPLVDNSTTSNTGIQPPNSNQLVLDANTGVIHASTSGVGLLLPSIVTTAASLLASNVIAEIILANNNVGDLSPSQLNSLQGQIVSIQASLIPLIASEDYGQASAASILSANLYTLNSTLNINQNVPVTTVTVTNPNLMQLASAYYNDSTLWPLIAQANNLQDMFPVGTFTLVIPPQNTQSDLIPTS